MKQDYTQAVGWYRKAAEQGHADAQRNMGIMFDLGHGVKEDYAQAFEWYNKAAEQGHSGARLILGLKRCCDVALMVLCWLVLWLLGSLFFYFLDLTKAACCCVYLRLHLPVST